MIGATDARKKKPHPRGADGAGRDFGRALGSGGFSTEQPVKRTDDRSRLIKACAADQRGEFIVGGQRASGQGGGMVDVAIISHRLDS